jgi:hypothetical protein
LRKHAFSITGLVGVLAILGAALIPTFTQTARADGVLQWTGQGVHEENGNIVLNKVICDDVTPPGTIHWIFTPGGNGNSVTTATLTVNGNDYVLTKSQATNSPFSFYTSWYDLDTIVAQVAYNGNLGRGAAQLVISHGCPPVENQWCSPGFWRNHLEAAEFAASQGSYSIYTTTYSSVFGAAPSLKPKGVQDGAPGDPTLLEVLENPQWYADDAFNSVGDLLSTLHPDVNFNGERPEGEHDCPLDDNP